SPRSARAASTRSKPRPRPRTSTASPAGSVRRTGWWPTTCWRCCPRRWPRCSMAEARTRPAWADINLDAIEANTRAVADYVRPAAVCAVVKANGYGHGADDAARAALRGGAARLGVALAEEGVALRKAGIEAPVLLLSQPSAAAMADVVRYDLTPTLYSTRAISALASAAKR